MIKRIFDLFFSLCGLVILFPFFIAIALWIKLDSKGSVFFKQKRVGQFDGEIPVLDLLELLKKVGLNLNLRPLILKLRSLK